MGIGTTRLRAFTIIRFVWAQQHIFFVVLIYVENYPFPTYVIKNERVCDYFLLFAKIIIIIIILLLLMPLILYTTRSYSFWTVLFKCDFPPPYKLNDQWFCFHILTIHFVHTYNLIIVFYFFYRINFHINFTLNYNNYIDYLTYVWTNSVKLIILMFVKTSVVVSELYYSFCKLIMPEENRYPNLCNFLKYIWKILYL